MSSSERRMSGRVARLNIASISVLGTDACDTSHPGTVAGEDAPSGRPPAPMYHLLLGDSGIRRTGLIAAVCFQVTGEM